MKFNILKLNSRIFLFLNGTRVGLILPNYNHYFEKKNDQNMTVIKKDSRINPTLSIISLSAIL